MDSTIAGIALRRRLIRAGLKPERCELCGWCERAPDGRVPLELDHINGNRFDNRLENLRILCPNCHSHQPTHRGLKLRKPLPASPGFKQSYAIPAGTTGPPQTRGRRRSWSDEGLREAISLSKSYAEVLRRLAVKGSGPRTAIYRRAVELEIDTSHFLGQGWRVGSTVPPVPAQPIETVLVESRLLTTSKLRQRLIAEALKLECCELCGWAERAPDGRLPLELDHINGDHLDNRLENLRILCPNCHSLQLTHRGSNQQRRKRIPT